MDVTSHAELGNAPAAARISTIGYVKRDRLASNQGGHQCRRRWTSGGAQGRPVRERVDAGNPRSSPQHKARNRLPMGARQVTAQADTREGARVYGRATRGVSPPEGRRRDTGPG